MCMRRSHQATPEGMQQVKVSKKEKSRRKLPNQGAQILVGKKKRNGYVYIRGREAPSPTEQQEGKREWRGGGRESQKDRRRAKSG